MVFAGVDQATLLFRRVLRSAASNERARVDALLALGKKVVFAPLWPGQQQYFRTLTNPTGQTATPLFTGRDALEMAADSFGWRQPDGEVPWRELGAKEAVRHAVAHGSHFIILDLGADHCVEFDREEIEPLLGGQAGTGAAAAQEAALTSAVRRASSRPAPRPDRLADSFIPPPASVPPPPPIPAAAPLPDAHRSGAPQVPRAPSTGFPMADDADGFPMAADEPAPPPRARPAPPPPRRPAAPSPHAAAPAAPVPQHIDSSLPPPSIRPPAPPPPPPPPTAPPEPPPSTEGELVFDTPEEAPERVSRPEAAAEATPDPEAEAASAAAQAQAQAQAQERAAQAAQQLAAGAEVARQRLQAGAGAALGLANRLLRGQAEEENVSADDEALALTDETLDAVGAELRKYPEVEWAACMPLPEEGGTPEVALRIEPSFMTRADEITQAMLAAADAHGEALHVELLTSLERAKECRQAGTVFFPGRRRSKR